MYFDLGFALLVAALVVWLYSLQRAEISSIAEMLKRVLAVEETREPELDTGVATESDGHDNDLNSRIREQVLRECPRYSVQDSYTVGELTRSYEREDSRGRIRILRRLYRQMVRPPYVLALKAVTDSDSWVREWMAREAQSLDYSERQISSTHAETASTTPGSSEEPMERAETATYLYPERNLIERLKQDSDPFVRAALYENQHLSVEFGMSALSFGIGGIETFRKCFPLERLAMMRNKELGIDLVKHILDLRDSTLDLEIEERTELAKACLVNPKVVRNGRLSREMFPAGADGPGSHTIRENSKAIWELAAKWEANSTIPFHAYKYVQGEDEVKAKIYKNCENEFLRRTILESCLPDDDKTIKLGRGDTDPTARYIAYGRSRAMPRKEIECAILREKDEHEEWAIDGLLGNPWLGQIARELHKTFDKNWRQSP